MTDSEIKLLGEDDFLPAMEHENRRWRDTHVTNARLTTRDHQQLNYYCAHHPEARAVIVIVHGFCEFWGKYHEYAWYLWQAGYTVYFLEQRGHGYSDGKMPGTSAVHIDSFSTYVEDLREFMDQVVMRKSGDLRRIVLAHSMGGAITALFLAQYPQYFDRAILTSPMLQMQTGSLTPGKIRLIELFTKLFHQQKRLSPGQHTFTPVPTFATSSTLSEVRYDYQFNQRVADPHYQTCGATLGWSLSGIEVGRRIEEQADRIHIPVTLMQAGKDSLVHPDGFTRFMAKVPQAEMLTYPNARHELFNADEEERKQYFRDVLRILSKYSE